MGEEHMTDKIAVILSGCGVYDGSEVHEASAACSAISRAGKKAVFYAPDKDQYHMVNHVTSEDDKETKRNVLVESGRIARGTVLPLAELNTEDIDAIIIPGGFGAAKNLCSFATRCPIWH